MAVLKIKQSENVMSKQQMKNYMKNYLKNIKTKLHKTS